MFIAPLLRPRVLAALALSLVLATAAYGFAAGNDVPDSRAGSGEGDVSGYWVDTVNYGLNATDPTLIDTVAIDLFTDSGYSVDASATTVAKIQFLQANGTTLEGGLYTCAVNVAIPDWTCTASGTKANSDLVSKLRVIAYEPQS